MLCLQLGAFVAVEMHWWVGGVLAVWLAWIPLHMAVSVLAHGWLVRAMHMTAAAATARFACACVLPTILLAYIGGPVGCAAGVVGTNAYVLDTVPCSRSGCVSKGLVKA